MKTIWSKHLQAKDRPEFAAGTIHALTHDPYFDRLKTILREWQQREMLLLLKSGNSTEEVHRTLGGLIMTAELLDLLEVKTQDNE